MLRTVQVDCSQVWKVRVQLKRAMLQLSGEMGAEIKICLRWRMRESKRLLFQYFRGLTENVIAANMDNNVLGEGLLG